MNDTKFRENCRVLANDIVAEYVNWKKSLDVPQDWHIKMSDTSVLDTAALLYIAANMPGVDERNKQPCEYCNQKNGKYSIILVAQYLIIFMLILSKRSWLMFMTKQNGLQLNIARSADGNYEVPK